MSTYLQGVTDYIPEFQPFQPDLNFYSNVLQTKQTQYDSNWQSLNKMYGQYFYADLTRDGNIKKKDELLKNMEFNLKRVSQLDLSLEQNVNQATQVFKPFYEDKNLMKDMSWTKTYNAQVGTAQALQGSAEEDRRKQFWDTGLREMQYKKDEFRKADDATAMGFNNVAYTPYVNSVELAQKIAKDAGLSIESVDFSPDGKWIVTQKNGEKLKEPLSKLFEARLGSDPQVQAVYKTQAYVNRKDYAYSNAAQFNGDQNAAEMKYLENSFNILKDQNKQRYKAVQERSTSYESKIKAIEKDIADKKAGPDAQKELDNLKAGKEINDKILERVEKENNELNKNSSSTPSTTTGFINPYGDVNSLRWKVDGGMANMLMSKDLNEAAEIFAYKDAKTSIKENPYKVLEVKHAQSMQQIHTRGSYSTRAASIRAKGATDAAKIRNAGEMEAVKMTELAKKGLVAPKEVPVYDKDGNVQIGRDGKALTEYVWAKTENEFQKENVFETTDQVNIAEQVKKDQNKLSGVFTNANGQLSKWMEFAMQAGAIDKNEALEVLNGEHLGNKYYSESKGRFIDPTAGGMFNKDATLNKNYTVVDVMQDSGAMTEYKGVKVADPENRRDRAPFVVTKENIGSLTKEDIYNLGKAQQHYDKSGLGFIKQDVGKAQLESANYYKGLTDRLESYMDDNANVPFIKQSRQEVMSWLKPAQMAATENYNFEDWKYKLKEAIVADDKGADILFDKDNNLMSPEEIKQIASRSVYGEDEVETPKQGFWKSALNSFNFFARNNESLKPETVEYWKYLLQPNDKAPDSWVGEKLAKYSPYLRGPGLLGDTGAVKDFTYVTMKEKLTEVHNKAFKNMADSQWLIQKGLGNIPGSTAIGEGGTGLAANRSTIQVLPQAPGTKGFAAWHGFVNDVRNIGNFDGKQSAILFGSPGIAGSTKTALDSDDAVAQTQKGRALLDAMIASSLDPNSDLKPFTLKAQNIAAGDPNKGAMIIVPDQKWLEQYKSSKEGEDNLLTAEEYNSILQNGLTVVSDLSNFNNSAITSTYKTAMESIVDYNGFYEENVPGAGKFRVEKGGAGVANYVTSTSFKIWDPQRNTYNENLVYDSFLPKERNLEQYREDQMNNLYEVDRYNTEAFNADYDINY
jgi:hypothetical protein